MEEKEILLETGTNEFEILEFIIEEKLPNGKGTERHCFGVNVAKVVEVIESQNLEAKDYAVNPCFLGTMPLRDIVLPVIDLSVWLGIKRNKHAHENIIVTEFSQTIQGFLVSGVVEIQRLNWKDLIPPGEYIRRLNTKSIIGVVDREDHFIQLLDLEHIVSDLSPESAKDLCGTTVRASKEYRALVVEDSPTIQEMIDKSLKISNFKVELVNNGEEAFKFLTDLKAKAKAAKKKVKDYLEVVISDIEMPLLDGFTLTKKIKNDAELQDLPVILYSSIITDELRHKGESVKADVQISKPEMNRMAEMAIGLIER